MDQTLRLHYAPDNASLIIRLALEEMSLPYETVLVDRSTEAQKGPEYRAINPAGLIPALETKDGAIFETGAILLWLTETTATMAPQPSSPERGAFLKWLFYMSNTQHTNLRLNFYAEKYIGEDLSRQAELRRHVRGNLVQGFDLLEALAHEGHDWFCGAEISVLDLYVTAMLRWSALYPKDDTHWFDLSSWPKLKSLAAKIDSRASVARLCLAEGMDKNPFSQPDYPDPPEGVAL